jgi:hypothetical protein
MKSMKTVAVLFLLEGKAMQTSTTTDGKQVSVKELFKLSDSSMSTPKPSDTLLKLLLMV